MDGFKDELAIFLLNISFVGTLFFIYYKYIEEKYTQNYSSVFITFVSGISIILCMIFTINPIEGFIFDMRHIPFIIGALYGGRTVGFILLVILLSFRIYIGGVGIWFTALEFFFIYSFLWFCIPRFQKLTNLRQKIKLATNISLITPIMFIIVVAVYNLNLTPPLLIILIFLHTVPVFGVIFFIRFIEKVREENLLLKEVKELEKMKIVSEIAASISHEVRNPLTVTSGFLQLLKDPDIPPEKRSEYVDYSLKELKRAEIIINDYLTFAKPSLDNIQLLHIEDEIEYVINIVNPYAVMNNVEILFEKNSNVVIAGERQKLHQCLINLMKNGIEAMPEGGRLDIELILNEKTRQATISISDSGVGMDQEQLERLGTPYYTTKGSKGTGLGTMVVYSIVKVMRGHIEVESEKNKGTRFVITLPCPEIQN
ncbi:ATP-binding protein [Bacillus sp. FJAT-45350]|uniref:ATP-binding protein n=1 Tax=Bacillus sp. FJAT-45350 TaxID=2011014 RepID=UPI000BB9292C|nr:sensor histidine kinase [Bacillus sp. FJAT-45350]